MSGLLILSSHRLILASGPFHHIIPYTQLLAIEDDGTFPLPDGGKVKILPIVHTSGIDAYLTMCGVTSSIKKSITREVYSLICNFFRGAKIDIDGNRSPVSFSHSERGVVMDCDKTDPIVLGPVNVDEIRISRSEDEWLFQISGPIEYTLITHPILGKWLDKFIDSYFLDSKEEVEERYLNVLRYLNDHPSTTSGLTTNLSMVALEASTILNEMVFLGWVSLDHLSKLYRITDAGAGILSNSQT